MKKKYILKIELEANINECVNKRLNEKYVKDFYREYLKDEKGVLIIFRNIVCSYISDGKHIFVDQVDLKKSSEDETETLKSIIDRIPKDKRKKISELLEDEEKRNIFWEDFFQMFGKLKINKMNLFSRKSENK